MAGILDCANDRKQGERHESSAGVRLPPLPVSISCVVLESRYSEGALWQETKASTSLGY